MDKIDFVSSFVNHNNQYLTWRRFAKSIYGVNKEFFQNETIKPIISKPIYKFNKETYSIKSIIDESRKVTDRFIILNSDIEINDDLEFWQKITRVSQDALILGNRYNYTDSYSDGAINLNGIDFFLINQNLQIPEDHTFCIGFCSWDWWIPFLAMQQKIPIFKINHPFLYHKIHKRNWGDDSYRFMLNHFLRLTGYRDGKSFQQKILDSARDIL